MESIELKDFCSQNLLEDKLFITPTRAIGLQMINKMAMEGYPSINIRVVSLQGLAFEICEEYIEAEGKLIIDNILGNNLIIGILKDLAKKNPEGFFFKTHLIDAKTAEEIYKTIMELKYSQIKVFPKIKNLDIIHKEYENKLKEMNALDYCDIIIKAYKSENIEAYRNKKIAIASNIEFRKIEEKLFKKLTEKNCTKITMPVKLIDGMPKNYYYKDNYSSKVLEGKNINFFQGYGTKNEIDYIIRDIIDKKIPLDEVVIAYTNTKYANLINIEFEKNKIPITFGGGLGIETSSIYRFINTIFIWATKYYNVKEIRPIFSNGDIIVEARKYRTVDENISAPAMYEGLVNSKILFGKENYNRILKLDKDEYEVIKYYAHLKDYEKAVKLWLREFFNDLFWAIPSSNHIKFSDYIPRLTTLITKYVKNINIYDGAAKIVILDTLNSIENIDMEVSRLEYFDIVLSYIKTNKILRSQAQPGHVFATSYKNAGYTGRKNLYLIGMDSNSLSNKVIESPILLDMNRSKLSNKLDFAKESYNYKKYKIKELLTAGFENISIGYSNFHTEDVKVSSPSQIYNELRDEIGEDLPIYKLSSLIYNGTIYKDEDNKVEEQGRVLIGRDIVESVTALETLAYCPRAAYLKYKIGLWPKEDVDFRVDRWLDPLTKGIIVHEVLNLYFDLDKTEQIDEKLIEIVETQCINMRNTMACVLEEVYIREKQNILDICRGIIHITNKDKEWEVFINELSFGDKDKKDNKIFGTLPSQSINIVGLNLDITGAIDRVDIAKNDKNSFRIVDYKTGSKGNFEKKLRITTKVKVKDDKGKEKTKEEHDYSQTTKLQYYVYKKALEKILEKKKDIFPNPEIKKFTYIFEGSSSNKTIDLDFNDEFIDTIENRIIELLNINVLEAQKQMEYDEKGDIRSCKFCDYGQICMVDKDLSEIVEEEESYD